MMMRVAASVHTSRPWTTAFEVLKGEDAVTVRALVDRSIIEVFVQGGRASTVARDYNGGADETAVHVTNTNAADGGGALAIRNLTIYSMGCGWV